MTIYQMHLLTTGKDFSFQITESAVQHLKKLIEAEPALGLLRIRVDTGGCSGFQYSFDLTAQTDPEDIIFTQDLLKVVFDEPSLRLLNNSLLDYVEDMMSASFVIKNPNAKTACGCGNSFSVV